jgi:hypothetical protein
MSGRYDIWAEGYLMIPRRLLKSDLWRRLKPEHRSVVTTLWSQVNYVPGAFLYGTQLVQIGRGETAMALTTLADLAGVSVKVVRTTLEHLKLGSPSDGIGPMVSARTVCEKGRRLRVITLLYYDRNREEREANGTRQGADGKRLGASKRHARGTLGAPIEERREGEAGEERKKKELVDRVPSQATGSFSQTAATTKAADGRNQGEEKEKNRSEKSKNENERRGSIDGLKVQNELYVKLLGIYKERRKAEYPMDLRRDYAALRRLFAYPDATPEAIACRWSWGALLFRLVSL